MTKIFLSYRTDDSTYVVDRVRELLGTHFGHANVFRDRDSVALGDAYPRRIRRALERADVVLAIIGPRWLGVDQSGRRRIDDPRDWVRTELRMAFERDIRVVPVLLDGTPLPTRDALPVELGSLSISTYWQVRHTTVDQDVRGLIERLGLPTDRGRPTTGPERSGPARYEQHNMPQSGGTVYAAQGEQHIHVLAPRDDRP